MASTSTLHTLPRVLFLGTESLLSAGPLTALADAGLAPEALMMPLRGAPGPDLREWQPSGRGALPMLGADGGSTAEIASEVGARVLQVRSLRSSAVFRAAAALRPDVICVSCFPWKLPVEWLELPRLGCVNVHPSLLPAYRGPAPIFWALRYGERCSGVTVHQMTDQLDAGPILEQERLELPDGASGRQLDALAAELGGRLLVRAVQSLWEGTARLRPQNEREASYFPWPRESDFVIATDVPARAAFNFVRGVAEWSFRPRIDLGSELAAVRAAVGYDAGGDLGPRFVRCGETLRVQFSPGVLEVVPA